VTLSAGVQPIAYEPAWRDRLLDLQRTVWGTAASPEEWDWWFESNPAGPRLFSIVPDGDRLAAASGMSFLRMRLGGEEAPVVFALDAITHPDYRGRGLWSALELWNEEESAQAGARAALGFTNPVAGPILVGKLGWRELAQLRVWARPVRRRGTLGFGPERGAARTLGFDVEPLERFGPETEALAEDVAAAWSNYVVRDVGHLNWRYADSPRPYRALAARRRGSLDGYAVVTHKLFAGRPVAAIADLVARTPLAARALLRRCGTEVEGAHAVLAFVSAGDQAAYLASGFVPTHRSVRFIGKPLADDVELATTRQAWHFGLGDMDVF
jgi:GNAT superfamily N-acetyltransferase